MTSFMEITHHPPTLAIYSSHPLKEAFQCWRMECATVCVMVHGQLYKEECLAGAD